MVTPPFSFCVTCRGRLNDLAKTLPHNLKLLRAGDEMVVLDYHDPDPATFSFLLTFKDALRAYRESAAPRFVMSHAKNVVHLLARGSILVNLDADNYLDDSYLHTLLSTDWTTTVMLYPHQGKGGFKGRIAIRRDIFMALGGYDEDMAFGYGYEEIDLYRRAKQQYGKPAVRHVVIDPATAVITEESVKQLGQAAGFTVQDSVRRHRRICEANLKAGRLTANAGRTWGEAEVTDAAGRSTRINGNS